MSFKEIDVIKVITDTLNSDPELRMLWNERKENENKLSTEIENCDDRPLSINGISLERFYAIKILNDMEIGGEPVGSYKEPENDLTQILSELVDCYLGKLLLNVINY